MHEDVDKVCLTKQAKQKKVASIKKLPIKLKLNWKSQRSDWNSSIRLHFVCKTHHTALFRSTMAVSASVGSYRAFAMAIFALSSKTIQYRTI